jgi:hypothetical protein
MSVKKTPEMERFKSECTGHLQQLLLNENRLGRLRRAIKLRRRQPPLFMAPKLSPRKVKAAIHRAYKHWEQGELV